MTNDPTVLLKALPVVVMLVLILFVGTSRTHTVDDPLMTPTVIPTVVTIVPTSTTFYLECVEEFEKSARVFICKPIENGDTSK